MFERLTTPARAALRASQDAAFELGHDYIGTEHLLLGLMATESTASEVLRTQGARLAPVRQETVRLLSESGIAHTSGQAARDALAAIGVDVVEIQRHAQATFGEGAFRFPRPGWSVAAKKALQRALGEAVKQGKQGIETEHLLSGVLMDRDGVAVRALEGAGVDVEAVRAAVSAS